MTAAPEHAAIAHPSTCILYYTCPRVLQLSRRLFVTRMAGSRHSTRRTALASPSIGSSRPLLNARCWIYGRRLFPRRARRVTSPPLSYHTLFDCAPLTALCSCCSCPSMPASSTPGPSPPPIPPPCCTTPAHVKAHSVRSVRFSASGMTRAVFRYYTVGLNEVADMQASYVFGLKWTPHTKIKGAPCNRHTPHCKHATQALTPPPQSMTTPPASSASWPRSSPSSPPPQTPCMCPAASCFNTAFLL